jgi:hypothetical protein
MYGADHHDFETPLSLASHAKCILFTAVSFLFITRLALAGGICKIATQTASRHAHNGAHCGSHPITHGTTRSGVSTKRQRFVECLECTLVTAMFLGLLGRPVQVGGVECLCTFFFLEEGGGWIVRLVAAQGVCDATTGFCPVYRKPLDAPPRHTDLTHHVGERIHPPGNATGTLGCVWVMRFPKITSC